MIKGIIERNVSEYSTPGKKPYETPELNELGTLEELTRWEASVRV